MSYDKKQSRVMNLFLLVLCCATCGAAWADWPNFRGPQYDGISDEKGFQTSWTTKIPLVWERELGSGFSSFACVGDKLYTAGTYQRQQVIYCLHGDTGKLIWQKTLGPAFSDPAGGDGPRATPTVDDGRVYMLGAHGSLVCLDAETGKLLWQQKFSHAPQWGYSGSVLIEGDLAIVSAGKDEGALVSFHKENGQPAWKTGDDPAGYATPYPFTLDATRYVVGFTGNSVIVAEAATGRSVWRGPWETAWQVNAASPIFHEGYLFLTSGYRTGCGLFRLRKSGSGLSAEPVWRSKVLRNKFQSCVLHDGLLYGSDQKALVCVDLLSGKELWRKPHVKHGTVVLADGHLLLLTQNGQLQIAPVSPAGFEPTTTADVLDGRCWTVPVLHRGKLYARNLTRMVCLDLKK